MVFASCLGRWSAEREHVWLMGSTDSAAQDRFELFKTLLEAIAPHAAVEGPVLLDRRITAKMAQQALLTTATFHSDDSLRIRAARQAQRQLAVCDMLVIG